MFKKIWDIIGKYVIGAIIILICLVALYFGLKSPASTYMQEILDQHIERYRIEYQNNMDLKDKEIQERDKQLIALSKKYNASYSAYLATKKELELLKKEIVNINEPVDIKEVKERLRALGYNIR